MNTAPHLWQETFRDDAGHDGRGHSTAILYLLPAGACSKLHRLDASEVRCVGLQLPPLLLPPLLLTIQPPPARAGLALLPGRASQSGGGDSRGG